MNRLRFFNISVIALLLCWSFAVSARNTARELTFLKGIKSKQIRLLKLVSRGGYMGKCLEVSIHNNTIDPMSVTMDPALIFKPGNDRYQHLVSVGEEVITLEPGETKVTVVQTFCGMAPAEAPISNLDYTFWKQGSPEMILASKYIHDHGLYNYIGQHAVWMFTNNHRLSNVYAFGSDEAKSKSFVEYLAKVTKQPIPQYFTYHNIRGEHSTGAVYDSRTSAIIVNMEWKGEFRRNIRVAILDANRNVYKNITDGEMISSSGEHKIRVVIDPGETPKGVYYVQMKDDENRIWIEKYVEVGMSS